MQVIGNILMFSWIPIVFGIFGLFPPRRAVLISFIAGWMFLPMFGYQLTGFPDYTKVTATSIGVLLAAFIFDGARLFSFRIKLVDLPMFAFCLVPLFSSLNNGLGLYNGLSSCLQQTVTWGLPWYIGRCYFSDLEGMRELAIGIFIGGLVYLPFCLYEIRFSPKFHLLLYGQHQHGFDQTRRSVGYRPMVFMQHGLAVGMWMSMAALIGVWLWVTRALRQLWGVPLGYFVVPLLFTAVLCQSVLATGLMFMGLAALFAMRWTRLALPVLLLAMLPPAYLMARLSGNWSGDAVVSVADAVFGKARADSAAERFGNEELLRNHTDQRPFLGWGGWGRNLVRDPSGRVISTPDSAWIIYYSNYGLIGLGTFVLIFLGPVLLVIFRHLPAHWNHPYFGGGAALTMVVILYLFDNLANAMVNPVFLAACGGITVYASQIAPRLVRKPRRTIAPAQMGVSYPLPGR